jgi:hypothetical protein
MSESQPFYKMYLQPLKKFPNPKEIVTFDIEATEWKNFAIAGVYDGKDYSKFGSVGDLLKFLLQRKFAGKLIFAHVLKYDGQFILDFLSRNRDYSFTPIINGGKLLEIKVRDKRKHVWRFRDSYSLLPSSLKDLTKSFDVEHKKLDEDEKGMLTNPEYNKNDCMGLYEVLLKFRAINGGFFGMTISQTSLAIFRMRYQKFPIRTVREHEPIIRQAYHGGRTEIFKYNLDMGKRFYYYDISSLYPSCMRDFEYPYGEFKLVPPDIDKCGFSYAVADDTCYFPVLPQKIGGKMMFLQGRKEGWYSNQELKHVQNTTYGNVEIKSTLACDDFGYIFKEFVDDMYKIRQEAKASGNTALDYTQKIILNSNYGKWGQKRSKEQIVGNPQEDFFIEEGMIPDMVGSSSVYKKIVENDSPHIIPSLSAMITANSRLVMHRYLLGTKPEHIYYMDTDSLITDIPAFQAVNELGKFKLECEMTEFLAVLPKVYHFRYPSGRRCLKAKGLHLNYKASDDVNVGCFKEFISGHEVIDDRGIEGFKRSCQLQKKTGDNTLLFNKAMKKNMHSYYDKRRLVPDADLDMACEPFKVGEDRSVNEAPFKELLQRTLMCLNR